MGANNSQPQQPQAPPPKKLSDMSKDELKEKQRAFKKEIQKGQREIEREIFKLEQVRKKSRQDLEKEIKKGNKADKVIKAMYAKQLVKCDQQKANYMNNKFKLQDVGMTLDNYFAQVKMGQIMGKSTEVMTAINGMMNIPEMQKNMMEMQREMEKMGIIDEMMQDTMEGMQDGDMDVDDEVEKMINNVEKDIMSKNPTLNLKSNEQIQQEQQQQQQQQQQQPEDEFADRLNALKN